MKKTASMILALLILLSTGMVPALAATEDTEPAVVPMENTRTVLRLKDGTSRDYAGMLKAGALGYKNTPRRKSRSSLKKRKTAPRRQNRLMV